MTAAAQHQPSEAEENLLARLKAEYEERGYTFEIDPREGLPDFLGTYRPDAIARSDKDNVAIEVKQRRGRGTELTLQSIRARFDGQRDWRFVVAYTEDDPLQLLTIPASETTTIRKTLKRLRKIAADTDPRAAFVMAWPLLEATLRAVEHTEHERPRTPGTVLQSLAMLGYIDSDVERRIRPLIRLRNSVVHGDLSATPTESDVNAVLGAVQTALDAAVTG